MTIAHSRSRDLPKLCAQADLVYAAVGRPEMVRGDWLKPGATVIDVGINRIPVPRRQAELVGDVAFQEALGVAGAITPVPGGVGQMTVACLLVNTLRAACAIRLAGACGVSCCIEVVDDRHCEERSDADPSPRVCVHGLLRRPRSSAMTKSVPE